MSADLLAERLATQHVINPLPTPEDVVHWLGAVQSQDYPAAKWALGLRAKETTDAAIDALFDGGSILRTHVLRPTWHFVSPADIRWMVTLTAPRVNAAMAHYYRIWDVSDRVVARSNAALIRALEGGRHLTRRALAGVLERARILRRSDDPLRIVGLMLRAELDGIICSGPRPGNQFTYALLDERAPRVRTLAREEARSELVKRYFSSHGPATLQDFRWWSYLTAGDARAGFDSVEATLEREAIGGTTFWRARDGRSARGPRRKPQSSTAHLLPAYDESLLSYRRRWETSFGGTSQELTRDYGPTIVIDGQLAGKWKRTLTADSVVVEATLIARPNRRHEDALSQAVEDYGRFLERRTKLTIKVPS